MPADTGAAGAYVTRGSLQEGYLGDGYAAMCSFGLCVTNPPHKSVQEACEEIGEIRAVHRKVVKSCSLQYDDIRRGDLYDPTGAAQVKADVNPLSGVISTRLTGAGAHFIDTDPKIADPVERMERAVQEANRTYCQPQALDPGGYVQPPFALDGQDRLYVVDQGAIDVPVLVYGGEYCIDYTSNAYVQGIKVIDNAGGVARQCVTRDFYRLIDPSSVYNDRELDVVTYTRRISGLNEGLGTALGTEYSLNHLHAWLASPYSLQHALAGGLAGGAGGFGPLIDDPGIGRDLATMDTGSSGGLDAHSDGDKSLLGGPLPVKIMETDHLGGWDGHGAPPADKKLANTVRVAPLVQHPGAIHAARFDHDGPVDTDLLAERMSRTGARNTIGIAMQKIAPNTQGDLMLHDGV